MPMLPLHVGWCLPLPIPSSKIALPIQKTHKLPYLKTHNPHTYSTQKLNEKPTTHKEVVSAQGAAVEATVGIGWSFGG
jgi:hypothetical protein